MKQGIYLFKEEFCKELKIPQNQYNRRQDDLLIWLSNYYDFELLKGCPIRIHVREQLGEYQPMPRKLPKQDELTTAKIKDYEEFTIAALGTEYKPNSKSKIARDAIDAFGYKKYSHSNAEAVVKRYIKKPFDAHGETNGKQIWVWYSTYEPLSEEVLNDWRNIMAEEHISEHEAANAFYKQEQGQDISKEKGYYKKAQHRFAEKYGDIAVLVKEWKKK